MTADNEPWWEGRTTGAPAIDWQGRPYDKANGPAAHPNSRFTVSAKQNPAYNHLMEHPEGVPISAILFGGRRREVAPLVYEARDWEHGVLVGAGMASETTAAAVGQVGVVRRDSMAMKPFCGYNFADYWAHWLSFEGALKQLPKVFHVNWFRQDKDGKFLWPGFGDNLRVLSWMHRSLRRPREGARDADRLPAAQGRPRPQGPRRCPRARCTSCSTSTSPPGTREIDDIGQLPRGVRRPHCRRRCGPSTSGSRRRWASALGLRSARALSRSGEETGCRPLEPHLRS